MSLSISWRDGPKIYELCDIFSLHKTLVHGKCAIFKPFPHDHMFRGPHIVLQNLKPQAYTQLEVNIFNCPLVQNPCCWFMIGHLPSTPEQVFWSSSSPKWKYKFSLSTSKPASCLACHSAQDCCLPAALQKSIPVPGHLQLPQSLHCPPNVPQPGLSK